MPLAHGAAGLCDPHEVSHGHAQGAAPGLCNPWLQFRLGDDRMESSPEDKDFRVLMDEKLDTS